MDCKNLQVVVAEFHECYNLLGRLTNLELLDIVSSVESGPNLINIYRKKHNQEELTTPIARSIYSTLLYLNSRKITPDIGPPRWEIWSSPFYNWAIPSLNLLPEPNRSFIKASNIRMKGHRLILEKLLLWSVIGSQNPQGSHYKLFLLLVGFRYEPEFISDGVIEVWEALYRSVHMIRYFNRLFGNSYHKNKQCSIFARTEIPIGVDIGSRKFCNRCINSPTIIGKLTVFPQPLSKIELSYLNPDIKITYIECEKYQICS